MQRQTKRFPLRAALSVLVLIALVAGAGCRGRKYENPITADTEQPDKVLFDKAVRDIEKGRYEIARLTLNTLMNTYDTSEFLAKSKLAIADSWMREGGSHGWAQAEAEYKDFILFYPTLEESAEAQMKICEIHFRQMEKPDRDASHMLRAEDECRQLLTQFPNSRFSPIAAQKLREIQEAISESEYRVGAFYHQKGSFVPAANRLQAIADHYPLFSKADETLWKLGDSYGRLGPAFRARSIEAYQRIVRDYPLSGLVDDARKKLNSLEADIPEADPVAYARQKYELENATPKGMMGRTFGFVKRGPDVSMAAKSGEPTMTRLRPTTPVSVPAVGAEGGVTDVTATTVSGASDQLDSLPDARIAAPKPDGEPGQTPAAEGAPASEQPKPPASNTKGRGSARKQ
ncbi:MAG: outer membrane protein assembly factor BamD [Bryobacteraceae bacterium]|nr:outer membrane protein assembly factor BamD [Bryobacteraceae bacterium]